MNREKLKALLPVLAAYSDGATVQVNTGFGAIQRWEDAPNPSFDLDPKHYRIKPTPITIHVVLNKHNRPIGTFPSLEQAMSKAKFCNERPSFYQSGPYAAVSLTGDKP